MDWAVESEQKLILLLLDFEIFLNKINWDFLFISFYLLGFNDWWVLWVLALYKLITSSIWMNGEYGLPFSLLRLVQQGYPLSPYLFIFTIDVFRYILSNPCYGVWGYPMVGFFKINHLLMILYFISNVWLKIWKELVGYIFVLYCYKWKKLTNENHQPFEHLITRGILIGEEKEGYVGFLMDKE